MIPKRRFKSTGSIRRLIITPTGAVSAEKGTIHPTIMKLILPTKSRLCSICGVCEKIRVLTAPGRQIIKPMADAVPIALLAGKLQDVRSGTVSVPPPIPSITEKKETNIAMAL